MNLSTFIKLSVIVPFYNAEETLALELDALVGQSWSQPWEIVLVDNRSTDRSREIAESYLSKLNNLRIVDAFERQGQPHALNTGIRAARGESVALCDADDEVAPGWVAAMGEALDRHQFVACRIDTAKLNPPWLHGHDQEKGLQQIWYPPWLPHAGGGTLGFRKALFDAVGEFDHSLPYLHDTDFCFRAQQLGHELHFVPDAVLHMRRRDCLQSHYRQSRNYAEYNVILARKYWSPGESSGNFHKAFLRGWYDLARGLPKLRSEAGRYGWMWNFGRQVGRLRGMLIHGGVPV